MPANCLNCGAAITGKYCPSCGQKKDIHRVTWKFIAEEIMHFFTHLEKGFIYSSLKMWANPGMFTKSYLDGKRKGKQPPVSFLLIWAAIFLVTRQVLSYFIEPGNPISGNFFFISKEAAGFYFEHVTALTILFLPVWTALSWLIGNLYRHINFAEAVIICFYAYGVFFMVLSLTTLIGGLFFRINLFSDTAYNVFIIVSTLNALWMNYSILVPYGTRLKAIRTILIVSAGSISMIKFIELIQKLLPG